jgi:rare lipoprotein A
MIATPLFVATLITWMSTGVLPGGGGTAKPQTGEASFYGPGFEGRTTASGETFDPDKMTAASPSLPLGTRAKVTNTETGKSVNVIINDRGPYAEDRVIDVTTRAAEHLGMKEDGVAQVKVQPLAAPKPKD